MGDFLQDKDYEGNFQAKKNSHQNFFKTYSEITYLIFFQNVTKI